MTSQHDLASRALARLDHLPPVPPGGDCLGHDAAAAIVDATLAHVEAAGDEVERAYLTGHHKRLIETLALTPKAPREGARFLDAGCYGYFGHWAVRHLGYVEAAGIEMPLPSGERRVAREVTIAGDTVTIDVHHFDLTDTDWPVEGGFDTAICLETLEHVDHDPSGVLSRLRDRLVPGGKLVFSVPNGVSYKTLSEFLSGMPPWTYWFYNPDLAHEPRHSLEYTPFLMALVLDAAGFEQISFRTIAAYVDEDAVADLYDLGERLGRPRGWLGETMIAVAEKRDETDVIRQPDALYSGAGYYESTWPLIDPIRRQAMDAIHAARARAKAETAAQAAELEASAARVAELEAETAAQARELEASAARGAELEAETAAQARELEASAARGADLEAETAAQSAAIGEMSLLLDIYARRLAEAEAQAGVTHASAAGRPATAVQAPGGISLQDRKILFLYRMMAPSGLKKLAEKARLPKETSWTRHLRRHPGRVSEWQSIKRLARRGKQGRNPQLLRNLFGTNAGASSKGASGKGGPTSSPPQDASPRTGAAQAAARPPKPAALTALPPPATPHAMEVPPYVAAHAAAYQIDLYRDFHERVDVAGARVLEVGSDYHLATARLFAANGAARVVATNIGDWKSPEPMPERMDFVVGDVADTGPKLGQFDVIYGIAVLEHLPDVPRVARALRPLLAPGGIAFLQGEPIWGGSLGHHVWFDPVQGPDPERFAAGGSRTAGAMAYAFNDPATNPIPDWAHLVLMPEELRARLVADGLPEDHAAGIVDYVYNLSGAHVGSCSNFQVASAIIEGFSEAFEVHPDRQQYDIAQNEFYLRARERYSEEDLQTLGLRLWMR